VKAAFIGVGKMGFPVSLAHCLVGGHEIFAYDSNPVLRAAIRNAHVGFYEPEINDQTDAALKSGRYHVCDTIGEAVKDAEVILVAVPTPSLPDNSFDNSYVADAAEQIGHALVNTFYDFKVVILISTVLPGTTRKVVQPALEGSSFKKVGVNIGLDYSASFIAMGTTFKDAINPEFVLVGASDPKTAGIVSDYFGWLSCPKLTMTYEEAELTKNVYNVHIGFKIIIANAVMELAHKLGNVDCDKVTDALGRANRRIVGPMYLKGGMGDGGSCHGRDSLALSSVAKRLGLSADPFDYIMQARNAQADWLAKTLVSYRLPIVIMGERYKASTNLLDYSASKLVAGFLSYYGVDVTFYDPVLGKTKPIVKPSAFLVALPEGFAKDFPYPKGSIVVDVWRCFDKDEIELLSKDGVSYVPVGRPA
jgi:UDPglucose 6-dehydrogenase